MKNPLDFVPPGVALFVKGAIAAAVGGAVTAIVAFYTDPEHYSIEHLSMVWPIASAGAIVALTMYLRNSPLPQWRWERKGGIEMRGKD